MESSGLPPPPSISKVPDVKMVSTSNDSSSAISSVVCSDSVDVVVSVDVAASVVDSTDSVESVSVSVGASVSLDEPMSGRVRTDPGTVRPAL